MKRCAETFIKVANALCVDPSLTRACELANLHPVTGFRWLNESRNNPDDPRYLFEWGEHGVISFFESVKLAQRIQSVLHISEMRSRARFGFKERVVFQGKLMYADNPKFVSWTDAEMIALGFDPVRDRILYDDKGHPVPLEIVRQPSDTLSIQVAKIYGGPEWQQADRREIDVRHSGGVLVVGQQRQEAPRAIARPVRQIVEHVVEQVVEEEIIAEDIAEQIADDDTATEQALALAEIEIETAATKEADRELIPETAPPPEETAPDVPEVSADLDPAELIEADRAEGVKPDPWAAEIARLEAKQKALADAQPAPAGGYIPMGDPRRNEGWKYAKRDTSDEDHVGSGHIKPGGTRTI